MSQFAPRFSIVLPVYNEGANIAAFCKKVTQSIDGDYELLVCYDVDDDDTLPALAAIPSEQKPPCVRLVRNQLGPGPRYAIEAGMRAAASPIIVVMMADLSDDFGKLAEMVSRGEAGAAVVCASRYMRGGRQVGGPWLKKLLSRVGGVTLHWLAGVPTHDPTNSYKAYRRDFLERTPIESVAGFALAIELTVKAHFHGYRVEEVPAVWLDRFAGKSRFRLWKWMPTYLYWYMWAIRRHWIGHSNLSAVRVFG